MSSLTYKDFTAFFSAIWSVDPFPWQRNLLAVLATGKDAGGGYDAEAGIWPSVLDLPTGSGKTAALDIAIFHLALEAARQEQRRAPVRIAFVVDRRLIVDDAFTRAERLAKVLDWSLLTDNQARKLAKRDATLAESIHRVRSEPVVSRVAVALQRLAGPGQAPLIVRSLRGGAPREDEWARTPVQPTILCSTVDQVGSRLLFRGYGTSDSMKPIHAGLLGSDCLILLDEAHLSEPFRQTLTGISRLRLPPDARNAAADAPDNGVAGTPFAFVVLTATPRAGDRPAFGLGPEDYAHPVLSARLAASKPARLVEIGGKQGVDSESRRVDAICSEVSTVVDRLKDRPANAAIGVFVNRVSRARAVFEELRWQIRRGRVMLFIGPARPVDRDQRSRQLAPIQTGRNEARNEMIEPLIVVATQTLEAGVDVDFDYLVTEAAALDALRQRFGRLNRGGRAVDAEGVVLAHKDDIGSKADDPVYGDRIRKTWAKLKELAPGPDDRLDFGILALRSQIGTEASEFASPAPDAPVLMPAYIDLWSQTSPIPNADPEVALFLHGQDRSAATVQILWRADIDEHNDLRPAMQSSQERRRLIELFKLVPPRAAEAVEIPLWAARAWLEGSSADPSDFSDAVDRIPSTVTELEAGLPAFRWAWEDSERTGALHARALRGGDLIVIPAAYGGCDEWGWNPKSSTTVLDVADPAAWPYRGRRFAVRVTPTLIAQELRGGGSSDAEPATDAFLTTLAEHEGDGKAEDVLSAVLDLPVVRDPLRGRLERLQRAEPGQLHGAERRTGALDVNLAAYGHDSHERPRGVVFAALRGLRNVDKAQDEGALPATESEEQSLTADRAVTLVDHSEHVRAWASLFVQCAGLAPPTAEDVVLSAYLHDPGKADPRWQAYAFGGDPYGPTTPNEAIAKSGRLPPRGAWENAGLPPHWRHETLSVRLAIANPLFAGAHDPLLVIWLIGTHHGFGRPLFPHDDPLDQRDRKFRLPREIGADLALPAGAGPQSLAFDFRGWDWARVFEILKSRYGAWGLARLEAFVRLADHRASEAGMSPRPESTFEEAAE